MAARERSPEDRKRDLDLVRRVLRGDAAAEREFVDRMGCVPRMVTAKNLRLGSPLAPDELEDVVQEVLIALWRKLEGYNGAGSLETWAYQFCFLEVMRRLRDRRRKTDSLEDAQAAGDPELVVEVDPTFLDHERVHVALASLSQDEAEVVRLKHFEDLTFESIGPRLSVSPNTAKTRYYRGLLKLRRLLGESTGERTGGEGL